MDVLKFWRNGSHVVSLNWQNYDTGMQVNEGMFVGSGGWILKPARLLGMSEAMASRLRVEAEVVGISSCAFVVTWYSCNGHADKDGFE